MSVPVSHAARIGNTQDVKVMRLASKVMLELSIELERDGLPWVHPWEHYPFMRGGTCVWLRYQNLDADQRTEIRKALIRISRIASVIDAFPGSA